MIFKQRRGGADMWPVWRVLVWWALRCTGLDMRQPEAKMRCVFLVLGCCCFWLHLLCSALLCWWRILLP